LPYGLLLTGIGGTGVVTVSAILGTAAHLEGRAVRVLDVTGVAQKNGAVTCHLQWSDPGETLHAARLGPGRVSLVLACDSVVAGSEEVRCLIDPEETHVVANSDIQATAASTFDPDGIELDRQTIDRVSDSASCVAWLPANRLAQALCGDTIYGNILQLGLAVQRGLVSISRQSVEQAIELNGVAVAHNKAAFAWGRLAAADLGAVTKTAGLDQGPDQEAVTLDDLIDSRCDLLIAYQGDRLAERFLERVQRIRFAESAISEGHALTEAVARNYAKLLAYKDEYEVARLYSDGAFRRAIADRFGDAGRVRIWLAPPLLAARDPETGRLVKRAYGPWVLTAMTVLSRLRPLRGTRFDPFGRTAERRRERRLIVDYEAIVDRLTGALAPHNLEAAIALAGLPDRVRGYGHIKEASMDRYEDEVAKLLKAFAAASSSGGNAAPKQSAVSDIRPAPVTPTTSSTGSAYQ
ncbi:MAG: 2-oxoacid:acceptor oxidoreductase family protein, partial [Bauldia litoralis]